MLRVLRLDTERAKVGLFLALRLLPGLRERHFRHTLRSWMARDGGENIGMGAHRFSWIRTDVVRLTLQWHRGEIGVIMSRQICTDGSQRLLLTSRGGSTMIGSVDICWGAIFWVSGTGGFLTTK